MTPGEGERLGRAARRVLASPNGCRVVIADAGALPEMGDAGLDALLQLPERVQLLVTDLAAHYDAGDRLLARLLAHPRVQRLQTQYGRVWLETIDRAVRYADDARFRAGWDRHIRLPAPVEPGAPDRGMAIVTAAHHLYREEPPGLPTLVLAPEDFFESYPACDPARGPVVIAASVLSAVIATLP